MSVQIHPFQALEFQGLDDVLLLPPICQGYHLQQKRMKKKNTTYLDVPGS